MRCKNCGWPNKPNETTCVKCHTPLTADDDDVSVLQPISDEVYNEANLAKTVFEEEIFGGNQNSSNSNQQEYAETVSEEEPTKPCPKCGYPLRPETEKCPNCKFQIYGSARPAYQKKEVRKPVSTRRPTRMDSGSDSTPYRGTVNPYMMNMDLEPSFVLKPLKRANERHELEELEYEGKSVSLNRSNTEDNNASITSREQAVISYIDGHWFIEDKSEQKTTFVQAASKIELHDGDLILLGNRLFEFHK